VNTSSLKRLERLESLIRIQTSAERCICNGKPPVQWVSDTEASEPVPECPEHPLLTVSWMS
jgi:hypothetical protein